MSKTLRKYIDTKNRELYVTAFVAGEYGAGIQFTTGKNDYCCLSENQIKDLIKVLENRLKRKRGYRATDWGEGKEVHPEITEAVE